MSPFQVISQCVPWWSQCLDQDLLSDVCYQCLLAGLELAEEIPHPFWLLMIEWVKVAFQRKAPSVPKSCPPHHLENMEH